MISEKKNRNLAPFGTLFGTKFASKISKKPLCRAKRTILGPKLAPRASKNRLATHTRAQDSARACQVCAKAAPKLPKMEFAARPSPQVEKSALWAQTCGHGGLATEPRKMKISRGSGAFSTVPFCWGSYKRFSTENLT